MRVFAFGEVIWDIYENCEYIGGAPFNFAAHFRKCGGEAAVISAVGRDSLGERTVAEVEKTGIKTEFVSLLEKETGKCIVSLDKEGIPSYNLLNDVAYDYIGKPDIVTGSSDVLYFGTLALRGKNNAEVLKQIISENRFSTIFADMNIRPPYYSEASVRLACENATVLKISSEELPVVTKLLYKRELSPEESVELLSKEYHGLRIILVTLGDKGSIAYDTKNKRFYRCEAEKVNTVSTVGAGDSFSAAFLAFYLKNGDIQCALSFASKISGYVVSCKEAVPDYNLNDFI